MGSAGERGLLLRLALHRCLPCLASARARAGTRIAPGRRRDTSSCLVRILLPSSFEPCWHARIPSSLLGPLLRQWRGTMSVEFLHHLDRRCAHPAARVHEVLLGLGRGATAVVRSGRHTLSRFFDCVLLRVFGQRVGQRPQMWSLFSGGIIS